MPSDSPDRLSTALAVSAPKGPLRPVGLALQVVETVAELQPVGASDLSRTMALPKATVHRLLLALEGFGWLERDQGGRPLWSVSMKPVAIAGRAIERKNGLRIVSLTIMDSLRRATSETVHLGVLEGERVVLFERIDGLATIGAFLAVGTSWDMHWSSAGKAILAHLPEAYQQAYLAVPRFRRRSETEILPAAELAAELAQIRAQGFAITEGSRPAASSSVGAAIFDKQGMPFAGLSINGAADRLRAEQLMALAPKVVDAARSISMGMSIS